MNIISMTSRVIAALPGRPKSVLNRCVIEVFVAFLCCHFAFVEFSFVYGLLSYD